MPIAPKPTPTVTVHASREFPLDFPTNDPSSVKFWFDLRTVLLRNVDLLEAAINNNATNGSDLLAQLVSLNALVTITNTTISALTVRVTALENAPAPSSGRFLVFDSDIDIAAGIREAKLALNWPTHSNASDPTANEKAALAGTDGAPSNTDRYVTDSDPRLVSAASSDVISWLGL